MIEKIIIVTVAFIINHYVTTFMEIKFDKFFRYVMKKYKKYKNNH